MLAEAYTAEPGELQRVRVHIPDRPGVLAGITQALGAQRINIEDFELQHMSRDRGGTLAITIIGAARGPARGDAPRGAGLRRLGRGRDGGRGVTVRVVEPAASLQGGLAVSAVKGICQRAVLLAAIADGESVIRGFGHMADTDAAIDGRARARRARSTSPRPGRCTSTASACAACRSRSSRSTA